MLFLGIFSANVLAKDTLSPAEFEAQFEQARQAYQQKYYHKAQGIWLKLLKVDPTNLSIQNNLAAIDIKHEDYGLAKKRLIKAIYQNKEISYLFDNLNQIYAHEANQAYHHVFKQTKVKKLHPHIMALVNTDSLWPEKRRQLELAHLALKKQQEEAAAKLALKKRQLELAQLALKKQQAEKAAKLALKKQQALWKKQKVAVIKTLHRWQNAWKHKQVTAYLNSYAANFTPEKGTSHAKWVKHRTHSLTKPSFIKVKLRDIKMKRMASNQIKVTFVQAYRSNLYHDKVKKELVFKLRKSSHPSWSIITERVVK